jgi:ferrous iron transport protein A
VFFAFLCGYDRLLPHKSLLQLSLSCPKFDIVKKQQPQTQPPTQIQPCDGDQPCPQPFLCPLSQVNTGVAVRIKQLSASPEVTHRLREMGFCEEQKIKLLSRQTNLICQVCNARLGISARLADKIMVEPVSRQKVA